MFGSALFGMLSGSSVANAVTVGSLTIPAMIRVGYPRHFAAGVEAAASTGGQITPPIMGAAAFLMIEFLNVSYQTIIVAAIVPAFMHFYGVFMQVHFEAKRRGLRGLTRGRDAAPARVVQGALADADSARVPDRPARQRAHALPRGVQRHHLVRDRRADDECAAATPRATGRCWRRCMRCCSCSCSAASRSWRRVALFGAAALATPFLLRALDVRGRIDGRVLVESFETGAKYALAVGAAAATVGLVIGVVTLTGVGFKISYIITSAAQAIAGGLGSLLPQSWTSMQALTLLAALVMTGIVCILMGCGIPTTANYIIMVTVAAPTLVQLGVQPLVAHFFVFYYGVLADITPPVALAAYAAAGMAGSDPFKTGNTAFRLGLGKVLVPFVFVFSPSLLLVTQGFTWTEFVDHLQRLPARHRDPLGGPEQVAAGRDDATGSRACASSPRC